MVAALGRSGSGKSTLLHLLGGLDDPDAGQIVLAGHDITKQRPRALARTRLRDVGFVFQSFHLIEELSGEENVLLPARGGWWSHPTSRSRAPRAGTSCWRRSTPIRT